MTVPTVRPKAQCLSLVHNGNIRRLTNDVIFILIVL